jgi:hypothetical protein
MPQKLRSIKTPKPTEPRQQKPAVARDLSPMQELAADLFGDMLMNGARREETELLLNALLMHQWHRDMGDFPRDPAKALEHACDFARNNYDDTYRHLVASWPKTPAARAEATPKTVTAKIRHSVRDEVRTLADDFVGAAGMEELYLLRDILRERESMGRLADGQAVSEIYLATAIEDNIGSYGISHVRVPAKMVGLVKKLVEARTEIEEEEECA